MKGLAGEDQTFTLRTLALKFAHAAHSFCVFTSTLFRRLFKMIATLHLAEGAFALHLFFQRFQRLINVIVAYKDLSQGSPQYMVRRSHPLIGRDQEKVCEGHLYK